MNRLLINMRFNYSAIEFESGTWKCSSVQLYGGSVIVRIVDNKTDIHSTKNFIWFFELKKVGTNAMRNEFECAVQSAQNLRLYGENISMNLSFYLRNEIFPKPI